MLVSTRLRTEVGRRRITAAADCSFPFLLVLRASTSDDFFEMVSDLGLMMVCAASAVLH